MTDLNNIAPQVRADIELLVRAIADRQLVSLAVVLIEMYRPLSGIAAALWVGGAPVLVPFLGKDLAERIQAVLDQPYALEHLISELENASHRASVV